MFFKQVQYCRTESTEVTEDCAFPIHFRLLSVYVKPGGRRCGFQSHLIYSCLNMVNAVGNCVSYARRQKDGKDFFCKIVLF